MKIEVSNGEIVDKYTIVNIKLKNCKEMTEKHLNLLQESAILKEAVESLNIEQKLINDLQEVNEKLWDIEDRIRVLEDQKQFGEEFVDLARNVYMTNDKRFLLKRTINLATQSMIKEEKILPTYGKAKQDGSDNIFQP